MVSKIRLFFLKRRWCVLQAQATVLARQIRVLEADKDKKMHDEAKRIAQQESFYRTRHRSFFWNFTQEVLQPIAERINALTKQLRAIEDEKRTVRFKIETVKAGSFSAVAFREIPS